MHHQDEWHKNRNKERIDLLFVNLKVLSKLEEKQKLYTYRDEFILDDGIIYKQILLRWWWSENRIKTLQKIKELIRDSIEYGIQLKNSSKLSMLKILSRELHGALEGIKKLKSTYEDDKTLCSKLEYEMELLERNIQSINEKKN